MSFIDDVRRARALLREEGRVSLPALQRELGLDADGVGELVEEWQRRWATQRCGRGRRCRLLSGSTASLRCGPTVDR